MKNTTPNGNLLLGKMLKNLKKNAAIALVVFALLPADLLARSVKTPAANVKAAPAIIKPAGRLGVVTPHNITQYIPVSGIVHVDTQPVIASFSPSSGPAGTLVTINGSNLNGVTGVTIGGSAGVIVSNNGSKLVGMVLPQATTGSVGVTNDQGFVSAAGSFTVTPVSLYPLKLAAKLQDSLGIGNGKDGTYNGKKYQGSSVAISADGNVAVHGAIGAGGIFISERINNVWALKQFIRDTSFRSYGSNVSISADGNTIIVGSLTGAFGPPPITDGVQVYVRNGQTWNLQSTLAGGNGVTVAMSADGNTAVLSGSGIFRSVNGVWSPALVTGGYTGVGVAISADAKTVIIDNKFYTYSAGTWSFQGTLSATDINNTTFSSAALNADGTTAVIGSYTDNGSKGAVCVFTRSGNSWTQQGSKLTGPADAVQFGTTVSVSADGNTTIIGAPSATPSTNGYSGLGDSYMFARSGQTWAPVPNGAFANLGWTVAISANAKTAIIGSPSDNHLLGAVRVYDAAPAPQPTLASTYVKFTNTTSASTDISWTNGNGANKVVFISQTTNGSTAAINKTTYTANTTFGQGTAATNGWYAIYNGPGNTAAVTGLTAGATYRVQVIEYNGVAGSETYLNTPAAPANVTTPTAKPTQQALAVTFTNTAVTTTTVNWTNGNGAARAVFIAKTNNGSAAPKDSTYYSSNVNFGNGKQIGAAGWYCIYNGTGNTVNLTGLASGTTYRVHVVEYNASINAERYLASPASPANVTTLLAAPTAQAIQVTFSNTTSTATNISWTNGNGIARAVFIAKTSNGHADPVDATYYSSNANFANGKQIGATGWYCIYNGTGNTTTVTGLAPGVQYRIHVVEYNGTINNERYLNNPASPANVTAILAAPTTPAIQVTFNNITGTSTGISWTNGNGAARAVFIAQTGNGHSSPADNIYYSSNANFGNGKQIGATGWYCIYNGSGSAATVTGLQPGMQYRVHVVEYNGAINNEKYLTTPASPASVTTPMSSPTVQALKITFTGTTNTSTTASWTNGNGAARAVFVALASSGNIAAANNTSYTANSTFRSGTQVGTSGWYCVYNGTGNSAAISGLLSGNIYRAQVIEYNGISGAEKYLNSPNSPANVTTTGPHVAASSGDTYMLRLTMGVEQSTLRTSDSKVISANILSPNGDGKNDIWIIKNIDLYPANMVTVYDNSGKTIFSRKGYANDWDGTYQGAKLNEGTYGYTIDLGTGVSMNGFITVVRDR